MLVDETTFIVNSLPALAAFHAHVDKIIADYPYITFEWRIGEDRSLDQNALFHVWLYEYTAFLLHKDKRSVILAEMEGTKRMAKKAFYSQFGHPWMIFRPIHPKTREEGLPQYTSSKEWKVGEMFQFLTWLQMTAANDGLVLESLGEFRKNQNKHG
ncbi:MAG: hypothetical protein V4563_17525 [Pseudomonadota bacterium]